MKATLMYLFFVINFVLPLIGSPQMVNVTGKITNSETGKLIENANIFESKSTIGTITDKFGFYKLMLTTGDVEIGITCDGFVDFKQNLNLKRDTVISIKLEPLTSLKTKQKVTADLQPEKKTEKGILKHKTEK